MKKKYIAFALVLLVVFIGVFVNSKYRIFLRANISKLTLDENTGACKIFYSHEIYLVFPIKDKTKVFIINRDKKTITIPDYDNWSVNIFNILYLRRKDTLEFYPLNNAVIYDEQDIKWEDKSVSFTEGKNKENKYLIVW